MRTDSLTLSYSAARFVYAERIYSASAGRAPATIVDVPHWRDCEDAGDPPVIALAEGDSLRVSSDILRHSGVYDPVGLLTAWGDDVATFEQLETAARTALAGHTRPLRRVLLAFGDELRPALVTGAGGAPGPRRLVETITENLDARPGGVMQVGGCADLFPWPPPARAGYRTPTMDVIPVSPRAVACAQENAGQAVLIES